MLILFDLDDTLLDHRTANYKAALNFYKEIGMAKPFDEFMAAWLTAQEKHYTRYYKGEISFLEQRRARLRDVVDPTLSDSAADQIFAGYLEAYEAHWALFDDVLPCFGKYAAHRFGLITNGDGPTQRRKLAKMSITDKFDCIVISGECGLSKPDEKIFHHACELAKEDPKNVLYVGDRYDIDAQAARKAGLRGIWLDRHANALPEHEKPIISSLSDLSLSI